jgi:hypothetical protein
MPKASRCASTTKIIRPLESTADTQPQLQPALLRLSAIISQYFMRDGGVPFTRVVRFFDTESLALFLHEPKVILRSRYDSVQ